VTISPTGEITGSGYFNCVIGTGVNTVPSGPIKIEGSFRNKPTLVIRGERSGFTATLDRGVP